jgi:hypothetical protein
MTVGTKVYTGFFYNFLQLTSERQHIANRTAGGFLHMCVSSAFIDNGHHKQFL